MILWFVDRFGLPGSYYRIWIRVLNDMQVRPADVRTLSLHKIFKGRQLLTTYGTRKAPTWLPAMGHDINNCIGEMVRQHRPQAVVLAAPEALSILGLHPEHATLHNLRGSVYWRNGIPFLVTLPISAWTSMVTQKEIGNANFGYENETEFAEGRQGTIHLEAEETKRLGTDERDEDSGRLRSAGGRHAPAEQEANAGVHQAGTSSDRPASESNPEARKVHAFHQPVHADSDHRNSDSHRYRGSVDMDTFGERKGTQPGTTRLSHQLPDSNRSVKHHIESSVSGKPSNGDGRGSEDSHSLRGERDQPGASLSGPRQPGDESRSLRPVVGRPDADHERVQRVESPTYDEADHDPDEDNFFYEPVLSPIGRFAITADVGKLKRLLTHGRESNGPDRPLILKY